MRSGPALLLLLGCARGLHPELPPVAPLGILELARARPVPDPVQARIALQIVAGETAGGTGGVIVADRPGNGHLGVLGPLGSPVATVSTDGVGVAVYLPRSQENLLAADAAGVLAGLSGGMLGPDDLVAVLLGDLPLDGRAPDADRRVGPDAAALTFEGPDGWTVHALVGRDGAPRELTVEQGRRTALALRYEPFARTTVDGVEWLLPTRLVLEAPSVGLQVDVRYKSWKIPDPVPPVFSVATPAGATEADLAAIIANVGFAALIGGAVGVPEGDAP